MRHTTPFAAQFGVKSTKMQGKMRQNTLHLAPKRKAKCTKTQGKMHQNARQNAANCKPIAIICSAKKGLNTLSTD